MERETRSSHALRWIAAFGAAVLLVGAASVAHAQIGSGWTQYAPTKKTDLRGPGATYSNR